MNRPTLATADSRREPRYTPLRTLLTAALFAAVAALPLHAQAQDQPAAPAPRFVRGSAADSPQTTATVISERSVRQAHVEIDESTRTLIVTADPATNDQIRQILEALDRPVPQALINVLFLEVTHTDDKDLGVDLSYSNTETDGDSQLIQSLFGLASETRGGIITLVQDDLSVTLRAIQQVGTLNVLSRPSILARNKEEATITIGQEVPFIRNSRVTDDGQTINTVEYEDIGIILTVTPHINSDGRIELDIAPEISTLTGESITISDGVEAPVFAKRSAQTHVVVPSGKTIVIGGLMEDQETTTTRKVPLLGDIPLLGALFTRDQKTKSKTELLIFLTPTILNNDSELSAATTRETEKTPLIRTTTSPQMLDRYLPNGPITPTQPDTGGEATGGPD